MINALVFRADGRILVSLANDGSVRVWETKSGQCLRVLPRQASKLLAVTFHPEGRLCAHSIDQAIKIWDVESGRYLRTLQGHQREIWSLAWSPDGRFLLSGSVDTAVKRL